VRWGDLALRNGFSLSLPGTNAIKDPSRSALLSPVFRLQGRV